MAGSSETWVSVNEKQRVVTIMKKQTCFRTNICNSVFILKSALNRWVTMADLVVSNRKPLQSPAIYSEVDILIRKGMVDRDMINNKSFKIRTTDQGEVCLECLKKALDIQYDSQLDTDIIQNGCILRYYDTYR